jgi:hypothetical protein
MAPVAAAVLPHPPLLVPELAGAAAAELDPLRAACREALAAVVAAAELTVLVGDGPVWGVPEPSAAGSFAPYGVDLRVTLPALTDLDLTALPARAQPTLPASGRMPDLRAPALERLPDLPDLPAPVRLSDLPLSLAVAAHLLAGLDPPPARLFAAAVPASLGPGAAAAIGRALTTAAHGRVGLVVMADLSACRTERAPGAFRAEAADFDASVAEALRTGTPARLLDLDPALAADLMVAGRVPLQVLAGAFESEAAVRGQVLYEDAPYGVGYLVARLTAP